MAGNKVSLVYEVSGLNGAFAETQVRNGYAARFLGVICKVSLRIHIGMVADDLDGVLVCTDGTVRAESPEFTAGCAFGSGVGVLGNRQRKICNIVLDTDCEMLLAVIVVNGNDLSGVAVL